MRTLACVLAVLALCTEVRAQVIDIQPKDGLEHVGKSVRVLMVVEKVGRAKTDISLNSRESFKDSDCFIVRLTVEGQKALAKTGVANPVAHFARKTIEVTGTVASIKPGGLTRPAILVTSAEQIRVVDSAGSAPEPAIITADQAKQHIGKQVQLRMTVAAIGSSAKFLNLSSKQPANQPGSVQVRIGKEVQAAFAKAGIDSPTKRFVRREIIVSGMLQSGAGGTFVIDIESPADIHLPLESQRAAPKISELVDREASLFLNDGRRFAGVRILDVISGDDAESISALKVDCKTLKSEEVVASEIEDIHVNGVPMDLTLNETDGVLVVDAAKQKLRLENDAKLEERLIGVGRKLWSRLTPEEHEKWIAEHREFVASVKAKYPDLNLRIVETDFYILISDLDGGSIRKYMSYLDKLYRQMCVAYGIPVGENLWCGKCVVAAFKNQQDYMRFEAEVMGNPRDDLHSSGGMCHTGPTGRVTIAVWKGTKNDEGTFAHKLVHETSHGFVWRYLSNVRLPSWLNEGMADWIAFYIVKSPGKLNQRHARAAAAAQQSRSLGGIFEMERISREYYGAGSVLVDILVQTDADKFRQFFDGIKTGLETEDALREAYGFGFKELAGLYGRKIGLPDLNP